MFTSTREGMYYDIMLKYSIENGKCWYECKCVISETVKDEISKGRGC
jgi:hypothetical protein